MAKYSVIVRAPDGAFDVTQANSRKEADEMKKYAKDNYPELTVVIRKAESGLAILEGFMGELLR